MEKQKRRTNKQRSSVKEIKGKKDYAGTEASPYREFLGDKGDYNQEHDAYEPPEANPDVLPESASLWYQDPAVLDDPRLAVVKKEWGNLTMRQRDILQLCGYEGRTIENAAVKLGISKGTVQKTLERLRHKFVRLFMQNNRCLTDDDSVSL